MSILNVRTEEFKVIKSIDDIESSFKIEKATERTVKFETGEVREVTIIDAFNVYGVPCKFILDK